MKKNFILLLGLLCITLSSSAQQNADTVKGSVNPERYHKLNLSFTWFEVGGGIPLREKKLRDLPYGMNTYLYHPKGGMVVGLFGIGLYYKNHLGITVIFTSQDFSVPDTDFKNYISSQYPDYYLPYGVQGHTYTLNSINYRIGYRFHKGHFIYEPVFQLGVNDCDDFDTHFVLKEKGSNHFIEYDIKKENKRKNQLSYRVGIITRWRFSKPGWKWNIEPGLRFDCLFIPTNYNYIITTSPYNMPSTIQKVNVKQMRPAINITLVASVFRK